MLGSFDNVLRIHNTIFQEGIDDERLECTGFQFQELEEAVIKIYKVKYIKASSLVELPLSY